jgi:hypothetical protein
MYPGRTVELAWKQLVDAPSDGYTPAFAHLLAQHRRRVREERFRGITISEFRSGMRDEPPQSSAQILAVVQTALTKLQRKLFGGNTDLIESTGRMTAGRGLRQSAQTGA